MYYTAWNCSYLDIDTAWSAYSCCFTTGLSRLLIVSYDCFLHSAECCPSSSFFPLFFSTIPELLLSAFHSPRLVPILSSVWILWRVKTLFWAISTDLQKCYSSSLALFTLFEFYLSFSFSFLFIFWQLPHDVFPQVLLKLDCSYSQLSPDSLSIWLATFKPFDIGWFHPANERFFFPIFGRCWPIWQHERQQFCLFFHTAL